LWSSWSSFLRYLSTSLMIGIGAGCSVAKWLVRRAAVRQPRVRFRTFKSVYKDKNSKKSHNILKIVGVFFFFFFVDGSGRIRILTNN
jgi:hypothetical protein